MTRLPHPLPLLAALLVNPLLAVTSFAGSIGWGSSVNDSLYDSSGTPLSSGFQFELGTFGDGFVPTAGNLEEWSNHWKRIEPATLNAPLQYVTENSLLKTSGSSLAWERDAAFDEDAPLTNPNLFSAGEAVYVWAFNDQELATGTEWALVTGTGNTTDTQWVLSMELGDPLALTRQWRFSNATTAIYGGLNSNQSAGTFESAPANFTLQTALAIPEPGLLPLLAMALMALYRRRPRGFSPA